MNAGFNRPTIADVGSHWSKFLIWGLVLVVLGMLALYYTTVTTLLSVVMLGVVIFISSIVILFDTFTFWRKRGSGFFLHLIMGILYLIAGLMLINKPLLGSMSLTLILGIFYLTVGLFRLIYAVSSSLPNKGWNLFNALISLLLGILILAGWPSSSLFIIGLFIGIDILFTGWAYVMIALAAKGTIK